LSVASPTVHLPQASAAEGTAAAAAPEPGAAAVKGNDGQAPATQAPTFAGTAGAQPAPPAAERAEPPLPAQPPAGQVSVHIAKAVRAGTDRIHIQLAPASLGRVEISLDLSDSQQVRATISAETKEALELLRADARVLERALNDAGLKTDPGSLSFQLRDHGARAGQDGGSRQGYAAQPPGHLAPTGGDGNAADPSPRPAPASPRANGRIDIHA
jgi:flagellar hook-length control protein FliK